MLQALQFAFSAIEELIHDDSVTEILINSYSEIWFERLGKLLPLEKSFESQVQYRNFLEAILSESNNKLDQTQPVADGSWLGHRYSIVGPWISQNQYRFSLRKHPKSSWTLEKLYSVGWCNHDQKIQIERLVQNKKNLLVVGSTGSGKTSVLTALLPFAEACTRWIIIEDTPEIVAPNSASLNLLTRASFSPETAQITQSELLKASLRLRPDRILMGEIRGHEAKDFLMALSTGHSGSAASLHADNPWQSLLRLEMLIQMAAPQWQLDSIRKLIKLGLDNILLTKRNSEGQRVFAGCYSLSALEPSGFILDTCF